MAILSFYGNLEKAYIDGDRLVVVALDEDSNESISRYVLCTDKVLLEKLFRLFNEKAYRVGFEQGRFASTDGRLETLEILYKREDVGVFSDRRHISIKDLSHEDHVNDFKFHWFYNRTNCKNETSNEALDEALDFITY